MKYKVSVDRDKCISCGICISVCPEVFEFKEGKSHPKVEITDKECVLDAENQCPVHAIKIEKVEK